METYTLLRAFADSWVLLVLFTFFIGVVIWVMRPGSRDTYESVADIPFRNEDAPARSARRASDEEQDNG